MELSSRNFQPSTSNRKFQAIFSSPNRYFTENSRWCPCCMAFQFMQLAYQIPTLFKVFLQDVIRGDTHQPFMNLVLLEKCDRRLFNRFKHSDHSLYRSLPRYKESSLRLCQEQYQCQTSNNTERFKSSFFNTLIFKYNLLYMIFRLLKTLIFLFF